MWTSADRLFIWQKGTYLDDILFEIQTLFLGKIKLKNLVRKLLPSMCHQRSEILYSTS